jgi:hypothetical protein
MTKPEAAREDGSVVVFGRDRSALFLFDRRDEDGARSGNVLSLRSDPDRTSLSGDFNRASELTPA